MSKTRNKTIASVLVICITMALFTPVKAASVSGNMSYSRSAKESISERIKDIHSERERIDTELETIEKASGEAAAEVSLISEQVALIDQEYAYQISLGKAYEKRVDDLRNEIERAENNHETRYDILKSTLRAMEEAQSFSLWSFIFGKSAHGNAIEKIEAYKEIISYEKDLLKKNKETVGRLTQAKNELQLEEAEYNKEIMEIEAQKEMLLAKNDTLQKRLTALARKKEALKAMITDYTPVGYLDGTAKLNRTTALTEAEINYYLDIAYGEMEKRNLTDSETEMRLKVLKSGLEVVGKVPYFWGGRTYSPGWNDEWGSMRTIKSTGSKSYPYGKSFPYGMDCGAFVFWCALTAYEKESWESPVEWMATLAANAMFKKCSEVNWQQKTPGDVCVNTPTTHIGYYIGTDENGNELFLHCCSGYGVVVSTKSLCAFNRSAKVGF